MTERTDAKNTTSYGYGPAGRLEWLWNEMTGADIWYSWDAAGRPLMEQYAIQPEGSTEWTESARRSYGYDSLGRLTDDIVTTPDEQTQITATTYAYDLDDQLTWKDTSGTAGAGEHVYGYDQAGRMPYWTHGDTTTHYTWDAAGNRTKADTATATYDARNRLLTDGSSTYAYTPRGTLNTVTTGTTARSLTFDAFERKITDGTSTYTYDSLDRVAQHGTTTFRYDGGSNNLLDDGTTNYSRTPAGALLASSNDTTTQWSLTDRHTDLVAGLSTDGLQVTGSSAYGPFGTTTATDGDMPDLRYQSGWTDPANGDVNMAARWYQPGTGSFASRDTWQLNPSPSARANRYGYGIAAPLLHIDPSGHDVIAPGRTRVPYSGSSGGWYTSSGWGQLWSAASWGWRWGKKRSAWGMILSTALQGWSDSSVTSAWRGITRPDPNGTGRTPRRPSQPGFKWALVYTGNGNRGGASPVGYPGSSRGQGGGGGGCSRNCTVTPPPPPIDQNPNNGRNPEPAPSRPIPKPDWDPKRGGWEPGDGWQLVIGALDMLDTTDGGEQYAPAQALKALPAPVNKPGGKNDGRGRSDNKCDIGPGVSPTGHAVYLPRERYYDSFEKRYECRATGVYGLLDLSDYNKGRKAPGTNTNSSTKPPEMNEIEAQGHASANGHLIPAAASGSGIDLRNLVAEYRETNTPYLNHGVEKEIRNAIKSGKHLAISVVPHYGNSSSGIPTQIEYNYGTIETGMMKPCVITQSPQGGTTHGSADCPKR
ncbi:RHS repeat-associated core domain-containing protein [Streptomyces sp. M92]|uniref:RHS repeat-associated core domain-containing protein n=1 Tax=Streptomyces sp. M92 TaxID=2944250 RepID=UPI003FA7A3C0